MPVNGSENPLRLTQLPFSVILNLHFFISVFLYSLITAPGREEKRDERRTHLYW